MGFFDALSAGKFKKDESGRELFYPWGGFGKGRILPDEESGAGMRRFLRRYHAASLPSVLVVGIFFGWEWALLLACAAFAGYCLKIRARVAPFQEADVPLTLREACSGEARAHARATLWIFFCGSVALMSAGLFILVIGPSANDKFVGLAGGAFFGLCSLKSGFMLQAKANQAP
jgi:hypothetical protein